MTLILAGKIKHCYYYYFHYRELKESLKNTIYFSNIINLKKLILSMTAHEGSWLASRLLASDTEVDDHAASIGVKHGQHIVSHSCYSWPSQPGFVTIVVSYVPHDAELASVPYTIRNTLRKCLPQEGFEPARVP